MCFNLEFLNFRSYYSNFNYDINYSNNKLNINFIVLTLIYKFENLNKFFIFNNLKLKHKYISNSFNLVDVHNNKNKNLYYANNYILNNFSLVGNNFLIKNILCHKYLSFNVNNFSAVFKKRDKKIKKNTNLLIFNSFNFNLKLSNYLNLLLKYNNIHFLYIKKILTFSKFIVKKIIKERKEKRK
jgi:hypothetical protein